MPIEHRRAIACNKCKVALVLIDNDYWNVVDERVFRATHVGHTVVVGDVAEFGSYTKY